MNEASQTLFRKTFNVMKCKFCRKVIHIGTTKEHVESTNVGNHGIISTVELHTIPDGPNYMKPPSDKQNTQHVYESLNIYEKPDFITTSPPAYEELSR